MFCLVCVNCFKMILCWMRFCDKLKSSFELILVVNLLGLLKVRIMLLVNFVNRLFFVINVLLMVILVGMESEFIVVLLLWLCL